MIYCLWMFGIGILECFLLALNTKLLQKNRKALPKEQALQIKLVQIRPGNKFWKEMEKEIQLRGKNKDKFFKLTGFCKEFIREQEKIKIYLVDGEWIRNNICTVFGHGGHGLVHEFIPLDEVWVDYRHYYSSKYRCSCRNIKSNNDISLNFFNETTIHEVVELYEMLKSIPYWKAHITATKAEVGL